MVHTQWPTQNGPHRLSDNEDDAEEELSSDFSGSKIGTKVAETTTQLVIVGVLLMLLVLGQLSLQTMDATPHLCLSMLDARSDDANIKMGGDPFSSNDPFHPSNQVAALITLVTPITPITIGLHRHAQRPVHVLHSYRRTRQHPPR